MIGPLRRGGRGARSGRRGRPHLLLVLSLTVLASTAPLQAPASDGGSSVHPAVWKIHNEAHTSVATSFAIGPNRFVTNAHVVGDLLDLGFGEMLLTQEGNPEPLTVERVLALSVTFDLAHLETREDVAHHLDLAGDVSRLHSDWLTVHGYPRGSSRVLEQTEKIAYEDGLSFGLSVNGEGFPGLSGAPALDPEGKVALVVHYSNANFILGVRAKERGGVRLRTGRGRVPPARVRRGLHRDGDRTRRRAGRNGERAGAERARCGRRSPGQGHPRGRDQARMAARSRGARPSRRPGEAGVCIQGWFAGALTRSRGSVPVVQEGRVLEQPPCPAPGITCPLWRSGRYLESARSAFEWARKAAENGYNPARYNLSGFHFYGVGVKPNRALGRYWMRKAARDGNEPARKLLRKHLGDLCRPGCW